MKKNNVLTEHEIIYKYLSKLNFNKKECFEFKNDGALLKHVSGKELVVTNDSISENIPLQLRRKVYKDLKFL